MKNLKLMIPAVLLAFILSAGLSGCTPSSDMKADVLSVDNSVKSPKEINQILKDKSLGDLQIIDVRTPEEFAAGCLEGAKDIDLKSPDFLDIISKLDKEASYLVYCKGGVRSAAAAEKMRQAGIKNIIELEDGISNWEKEGNSLDHSCS